MSLALRPELGAVLGGVQRRERQLRRHRAARRALWGTALCLLLLGCARLLGLLPWPVPVALVVAALLGTGAALVGWWRVPAPTVLDAARTADQRGGLSGLLVTALSLPGATAQSWEAALHQRVRARAQLAAETLRPDVLLPLPPIRTAAWPTALLLATAALWLPTPLAHSSRTSGSPAAAAVDDPAGPATGSPTGTPMPDSAPEVAPVVNEPTPEPEPSPAPTASTPAAVSGPTSEATARSTATSGSPPAQRGGASTRPSALQREARQTVTRGTSATSTDTVPGQATRTRDTPFGSRESGQFQNQSVTPAETLASAPYDPSTAPGAAPMQQKSDPGSSGLRAASGGRGIESEGADKCVEGCLTNNDMNRGAPPPASTRQPPGGQTRSGTSDSGSGGAAGSSSGVGLGVGTLHPIQSRTVTDLGAGAGVDGDRVQVLAAPETMTTVVSSGTAASGTTWRPAPEPPAITTDIPPDARATVRAYFDRTAGDRTAPTRTAP